jgi:hypothetical protein
MFIAEDLRALLKANPFVPFRLALSDGSLVEVRHRDFVTAGRRYAVIGLPDPAAPDTLFDRHTVVWYMHVARVEMLGTGPAPLGPPPSPPETPSPAPA